MTNRPVVFIVLFSAIALGACSGGGTHRDVYYGKRVEHGPWHDRGVYVRDRVNVVTEDEVRAVEEVARELEEHDSDPLIDTPDMGGGFDDDF